MAENDFNEKTHEVEQGKVKCKDCGAWLEYTPGTSTLDCQYCGAKNDIVTAGPPGEVEEIDFETFVSTQVNTAEQITVATVKCDSCGASSTLKPNVTADKCPFCDSPLVIKNGTTDSIIRPKYMLPFSIDKNKGLDGFKGWLHKLWFAPSDLKKYAQNDRLNGMYIPYWTYDSNTSSSYSGMRGDDYYTTETYTTTVNGQSQTQTRSVKRTRWFPVSGYVSNAFDDVLVIASSSLPEKYANELEPWDLTNLSNFDEQYLSGFRTERYQLDVKEGFGKAKNRMEGVIRESIRRDIGGDHQQITSVNTKYADITFKHILLPIWLSAYRYRGKVYRFMINGRTGEVQGERPYSFWKIFFTVVGILGVIGTGIFLYMKYKN